MRGWRGAVAHSASATGEARKRRVLVLGSSGPLGKPTLDRLAAQHQDSCEVLAGTRDPSRLASIPGVEAVEAHMQHPEDRWLKGLDALVLIVELVKLLVKLDSDVLEFG